MSAESDAITADRTWALGYAAGRARTNLDVDLMSFQIAMLMDSRHRAHPDNGKPGDECDDCLTEFHRIEAAAEDALAFVKAHP